VRDAAKGTDWDIVNIAYSTAGGRHVGAEVEGTEESVEEDAGFNTVAS